MSLIWEHPKEDECDILDWIRTLVQLLGVSIKIKKSMLEILIIYVYVEPSCSWKW